MIFTEKTVCWWTVRYRIIGKNGPVFQSLCGRSSWALPVFITADISRGYFWGDRFKSVVVENGDTLINCLAYIDLNPIRAGLVDRPEAYRWSSIGHHVQAGKKDNFLSLDFGLKEFGVLDDSERFRRYRRFLYEAAAIDKGKGATIGEKIVAVERNKDFNLSRTRRFLYRTRYFTDSGIIGTWDFVRLTYNRVQEKYDAKREKTPNPISGLSGIYSLKRLRE